VPDSTSLEAAAPVEAAASAGPVEPPLSEPPGAPPVEPAAADSSAPPAVHFQISRWKKGDLGPHYDEFDVQLGPGATVLDGLLEIRRGQDPSLVVRHSCLHASCGTCGVRVNGRESLACDTRIVGLPPEKPVRVEPLANQRPVSDLATDMVDFYARFDSVGLPAVRAAEVAGVTPPENVKAFGRFENCIECGLCLSACPIARTSQEFIGPAALAAAARVVKEPRGHGLGPVLGLASEPDSVWRCHDALECTAVCPSAVDPAAALLELRRHIAATALKRLLRRGV